jgi:S-DNA-T family DNA segregation ATPase FtsK/SpoIIIE
MTAEPAEMEHSAEVVPIRPDQPAELPAEQARKPIIPRPLQRAELPRTVRYQAGLRSHQARYHGLRLPLYVLTYLWHALGGLLVLTARLIRWWHAPHLWELESIAVASGRSGHHDALGAHRQGTKTRASRGRIIAVTGLLAVLILAALAYLLPLAAWPVIGLAVVLVLARHGRPDGSRVISAAVVKPEYAPVTEGVIVRALGSLNLSGINAVLRDGKDLTFISPPVRDGAGWRAELDLPYGVTVAEVTERRDKLASGLRRPLGCVWPEPAEDEHTGRLVLYVSDVPLNKARKRPWPLTDKGRADLFEPLPFGIDQRGNPVSILLMFSNLLVGSIPRMGKTVSLLVVLLAAALDPRCEIRCWELKGTGDLDPIGKVAHRFGSGADDDTITAALADLRDVAENELIRRPKVIRELPTEQVPNRKVTPEVSKVKRLRLHPMVLAIDECQELFAHPVHGADAERYAEAIIKRGPALGIMLVLSTQRPDAKSLPSGVRANVAIRFCLRVMDQVANDMVLPTSSYRLGLNATQFTVSDKGIGWLFGAADEPTVARTYEIDGPLADRVCERARAARSSAGLLSGYAAGQMTAELPRSFAADVLAVFGDAGKLYTSTLAQRLARDFPAVYPDVTAAAVASQLRGLGVTVKNVREPSGLPGQGCERAAVEAVTAP